MKTSFNNKILIDLQDLVRTHQLMKCWNSSPWKKDHNVSHYWPHMLDWKVYELNNSGEKRKKDSLKARPFHQEKVTK